MPELVLSGVVELCGQGLRGGGQAQVAEVAPQLLVDRVLAHDRTSLSRLRHVLDEGLVGGEGDDDLVVFEAGQELGRFVRGPASPGVGWPFSDRADRW